MARRIDLNADLGESENAEDIARDIAIMDVVTSVNIACGGHAGTDETMKIMLKAATERGVYAGAHPSYPDRVNFGRITMDIGDDMLAESLTGQLHQIKKLADRLGKPISQIKPHGALYNDMIDQPRLTQTVSAASQTVFPDVPLVALAGSSAQKIAQGCIAEAFVDRRYRADGRLVPRSEAGAVIESNDERIAQALSIAKEGKAIAADGREIRIDAQTLCLHSDSDGALTTARAVRSALEDAGIEIAASA